MSTYLSGVILAGQIGLLGRGDSTVAGFDSPGEQYQDRGIVPTTAEDIYPGEFGSSEVFITESSTGNPLNPHGGIAGVKWRQFEETAPDIDPAGNESGLVGNMPFWYGDVGVGMTPMPGATIRVRRAPESNDGPVGAQDEIATAQYSMYQSIVDMANEQASQASVSIYTA